MERIVGKAVLILAGVGLAAIAIVVFVLGALVGR